MTGRDWVTASLRLIGAVAPGESLEAIEATDGLASANRMIDSFSNEGLVIPSVTAETPLALTPSVATVTMGTAGNITTRPMAIESAILRDGAIDMPVRILTLDEYAAIPDKTVQSTYPTSLYDDGGYPLRTLTLWPVPSAAKSLVLFTQRALTQIATLDTSISFPPGYERMLIYNLALELAPEYGRMIPDIVMVNATESKAAIKRTNQRPFLMRADAVPASGGAGLSSILTGGTP